jgi:hypothetical protein
MNKAKFNNNCLSLYRAKQVFEQSATFHHGLWQLTEVQKFVQQFHGRTTGRVLS